MKKITILLFCCLRIYDFSLAQIAIEWQKCLGGSGSDYAQCVRQCADSGYIIAGSTNSNNGDVTNNHGDWDVWIVKLDNSGNLQWQKSFGGSSGDWASSIIPTTDGGYIALGMTSSNDGDVSGIHGYYDIWVIKIDNVGNLQWQKCLGSNTLDEAGTILQTSDGGYILIGDVTENTGDVTGFYGNQDMWVVKLDSIGTIQWQKCFGSTGGERGHYIEPTADGGYVLTGDAYMSNNNDVSGCVAEVDEWVVKIDSIGNIEWQQCMGGLQDDVSWQTIQTSNGKYISAGISYGNGGNVTGHHGGMWGDAWIVMLNSMGFIQWQKCLGGTDSDHALTILQNDDGSFTVPVTASSNDGDINENHGGSDISMIRLDNNGNILFQKCLGGTGGETAYFIETTLNNGKIITGSTNSNNGDVYGIHGSNDIWVVKLSEHFNTIKGKLFFDLNSNQFQDLGEPAVAHQMIHEINTGKITHSGLSGTYNLGVVDSGNYTVYPSSFNYYNPLPISHTANFSGMDQTDSLNDFAFQPAGVFNDLCITITPMGPFRAGFNASYMINYENVGTTTLNATVIFFPDDDVTFVAANPSATSVTTDSMVWNVGTLTPFQTGSILVTINVNIGTPIGTLINSNVRIEPVAGDNYPGCNYAYWEIYTTGAVDPNAIVVDRDTVLTTELSSPPYLNYIIYFQNTGNDTAFNARVLNNIPQTLDVNSFEFVASSHPMNITYGAHSRLFTFTFDNINLPDSGANEPASHGFIRYRIKPLSTLVVGDSIKNNAAIYFDFNQPVLTDTAVTEIVLPTGEEEFEVQSLKFKVFPNPVRDELIVNSYSLSGKKAELKIFDLFGREVFKSSIFNLQFSIKINVSHFSQGIYFVELQSGEQVLRGKFLKE